MARFVAVEMQIMSPDFHASVEEARIAVESALVLADLVAQHEIVQSQNFDQLVIFLHDAVEVLAKMQRPSEAVPVMRPIAHGAGQALRLVARNNR